MSLTVPVSLVMSFTSNREKYWRLDRSARKCRYDHPVSQAQAGDLLFWGEKGNTYHVAIATGNGSFIHAPSTGYTVTEASSGFSTASFALRVK